jgi:predicted ABC-type ATPase
VPTLTLIAGPNGAGKSTITRLVEIEGIERLLDPDAIARRINPDNPAAAAITAGREVLRRQAEYFRSGVSFAIETTLAGSRVNLADEARQHAFNVAPTHSRRGSRPGPFLPPELSVSAPPRRKHRPLNLNS